MKAGPIRDCFTMQTASLWLVDESFVDSTSTLDALIEASLEDSGSSIPASLEFILFTEGIIE